jgi:hypothetical protein
VIVVDEYLAMRSLTGVLPADLPDEPIAVTTWAHWRILLRIHAPGTGQLSKVLRALSPADLGVLREPVPAVLEVLDPRPLLDQAVAVAAAYGNTGWHVAETLVAGLIYGRQLWFGTERNVGRRMREIADDLGVAIYIAA